MNLIEICRTKATAANNHRSTFYLVFDFCEHDLAGLLSNINVKFSLGEIKKVMQQLLNGLYYIHSNKVSVLIYDVLLPKGRSNCFEKLITSCCEMHV